MSKKVTLGGDRLGSGKKIKVELHNYERSTFDIGYLWRSSQAPGTLVPFMSELALPGDTHDINLNVDAKTLPTVGPLFGSFKLQLDVFMCPIRLYQGQLHNNKLGIGMNMSRVKLPLVQYHPNDIVIYEDEEDPEYVPIDVQQINPSSVHAYLGVRGFAQRGPTSGGARFRKNAIPYLAYWDIYKNYYANKQEEIGVVVHGGEINWIYWSKVTYENTTTSETDTFINDGSNYLYYTLPSGETWSVDVKIENVSNENTIVTIDNVDYALGEIETELDDISVNLTPDGFIMSTSDIGTAIKLMGVRTKPSQVAGLGLATFDLENIDKMREEILAHSLNSSPFIIDEDTYSPYGLSLKKQSEDTGSKMWAVSSQEGLGIKTYQSDIFNNWLSTEWIDGENGISAITAIDTSEGNFTLDTLNLSKKVYNMLNRIAVSGGSYNDWIEAAYSHSPWRGAESPVYMGGLSKEIVFEEVISSAETDVDSDRHGSNQQPLGSLAGKGRLSQKHKGGKITVKVDEPSYIIGIVSITPRIDYSQGNDWKTRLKTMDDFHKPALDQIGFQELITEQMACWDVTLDPDTEEEVLYSAGKQPAWLNYMTNYNKTFGNFADERKEMFMTLNRRYQRDFGSGRIKDLTSYIDPTKFNYAFAQTDIEAQNFWIQIACDITARRKMSAKVMPNL